MHDDRQSNFVAAGEGNRQIDVNKKRLKHAQGRLRRAQLPGGRDGARGQPPGRNRIGHVHMNTSDAVVVRNHLGPPEDRFGEPLSHRGRSRLFPVLVGLSLLADLRFRNRVITHAKSSSRAQHHLRKRVVVPWKCGARFRQRRLGLALDKRTVGVICGRLIGAWLPPQSEHDQREKDRSAGDPTPQYGNVGGDGEKSKHQQQAPQQHGETDFQILSQRESFPPSLGGRGRLGRVRGVGNRVERRQFAGCIGRTFRGELRRALGSPRENRLLELVAIDGAVPRRGLR